MFMKILFVSQYFYPENFRGNDIVFDLANRGHDITVLTGIPNYPKGKFFRNYGFFKNNDECIDRVKIYRSKLVPRGSNSISLALNYFSFPFFSFFKLKKIKDNFDIIIVQQLSPLLMVLPALWVKKKQKIPLISWVLDLWPESLIATTPIKNGFIINYLNRLVTRFYKESNLLLISSNYFRKDIIQKYPKSESKIVYFPNWAEDSIAINKNTKIKALVKLPNGYNVMFAGNVGDAQDFENIINAAELSINDNINWIIIGDGRKLDWVKEQVSIRGLKNVYLLGRYSIEMMPSLFMLADAMLVSLKSDPIYEMTVPAKIQAYMSCGKLIYGMLNGEGNKLINENKIGVAVPAGDFKALVIKIIENKDGGLNNIKKMEAASLKLYNDCFTKVKLLDKFNCLLNTLINERA